MRPEIEDVLPRVPDAWQQDFANYLRGYTRRILVVATGVMLVVVPFLNILEYWQRKIGCGGLRDHLLLPLPLMLLLLLVIALRFVRPDGQWPRPMAVLVSLVLISVGWLVVFLNLDAPAFCPERNLYGLTIAIMAVSVLATRGARDLLLIYLLPFCCVLLAIVVLGPGLAAVSDQLLYPAITMILGFSIAEVLYRGNVQVFLASRELEESATRDPLTGLLNRRAMDELLRAAHQRARRHGSGYAVIMADLDHFKRVNDQYGHDVGDQVLVELAQRLTASVRGEDHVARWGGEEFLVLLSGVEAQPASVVAEKIRQRVEDRPFSTSAGPVPVTLSLGVAMNNEDQAFEKVVLHADEALYEAKNSGRNRVVLRNL